MHPGIPAHRGVLGAGGDDVLNEGVPFDVQHISLVATNFGIVRFDPAGLERKVKENIRKIIKFREKLVFSGMEVCWSREIQLSLGWAKPGLGLSNIPRIPS